MTWPWWRRPPPNDGDCNLIAHDVLSFVYTVVVLWVSACSIILRSRGGLELWCYRTSLVKVIQALEGSLCEGWYVG
jgi:hypothetical protein